VSGAVIVEQQRLSVNCFSGPKQTSQHTLDIPTTLYYQSEASVFLSTANVKTFAVPCGYLSVRKRMEKPLNNRLARYELIEELGRGSMGIVYKARDPQIDRLVAIKTISLFGQAPEDEGQYLTRFFIEARAAGRLTHPGIVTIYDVGEAPETHAPYIVMEYVCGQPLNKSLAGSSGGKLPIETALQITQELAEALDYAHSHGVVHRDIKPSNVLMTEDGKAKIADFGIAKMNLEQVTLPGHVIGTPAFMSPEQLEGGAVDGRSDLFSLGVILYTILTGHRPFQGDSAVTVSFKVANREPVPATALDSDLPVEIDYVLARAMSKEPIHRYQTGREMALDISELLRGRTPRSKGDRMLPNPGSALSNSAVKILRNSNLGPPTDRLVVPGMEGKTKSLFGKTRTEFYLAGLLVAVASLSITAGRHSMELGMPVASQNIPAATHAAASPVAETSSVPATSSVKSEPSSSLNSRLDKATNARAEKTPVRPRIAKVAEKSTTNEPVTVASVPAGKTQAPAVVEGSLQLQIEHQFSDATIWIWVDGKLLLTQTLQGESKRKLGLFHDIHGYDSGNLQLPVGEHVVRVRVASSDGFDVSSRIAANLKTDTPGTLRVKCDKTRHRLDLSTQ
jgi:eukaryotic-like serine/threonine-protein kinase